jgi:hypothetical protein
MGWQLTEADAEVFDELFRDFFIIGLPHVLRKCQLLVDRAMRLIAAETIRLRVQQWTMQADSRENI